MSAARTFRSSPFGTPGISTQSLGIPAAAYPGRIATNSDLIVAVDRQQTTLLLQLNASDTAMTVLDPSMIVAYSLLSIDSEIVKTTGPPAGNVIPISRGFDGTAPAAHLSGAFVAGLVDAYHHNALVAEIEAIENALGPNLSQVTNQSLPFLVSSNYIFAPQSPGGSLLAGSQSITLSPVPKGVNGTDQNHYLYISGGTGAAEPVLITGGTAVSGATSGTLIVTIGPGGHSGAWTIQTATSGIQEAINSLPAAGGEVVIPAGTWSTYAPITVTQRNYIAIEGVSQGAVIAPQQASGDVFHFIGANQAGPGLWNSLKKVTIQAATGNALTYVHLSSFWSFKLEHCALYYPLVGILMDSQASQCGIIWIFDNEIISLNGNTAGVGMQINGAQDLFISHNEINGQFGIAGIQLNHVLAGAKITFNDLFGDHTALLINPGNGQTVQGVESTSNWYDSALDVGVSIYPTGTGEVQICSFSQDWVQGNTNAGVLISGTNTSPGCIDDVIFNGCQIEDNAGPGVVHANAAATNIRLIGCSLCSNGTSGTNQFGFYAAANVGGFQIIGGKCGQILSRPSTQAVGINIAGTGDNIQISSVDVTGNTTTGIQNNATGTHNTILNCPGYNPVGLSVIAVGASPFTYRAGPSTEIIYIEGGTVSSVNRGGGVVAFTATPCSIPLPSNGTVVVTYSVAPTMTRDIW